jgi:hypothetical protein
VALLTRLREVGDAFVEIWLDPVENVVANM